MKVTLASSSVAYSLYALMNAIDKGTPDAVFFLALQFPDAGFEAANSGATLKVGTPNSVVTPTDVTSPMAGLVEDGSFALQSQDRNIGLRDIYLKSSVNNAVVYVAIGR